LYVIFNKQFPEPNILAMLSVKLKYMSNRFTHNFQRDPVSNTIANIALNKYQQIYLAETSCNWCRITFDRAVICIRMILWYAQ
jgi:hypothetical protein